MFTSFSNVTFKPFCSGGPLLQQADTLRDTDDDIDDALSNYEDKVTKALK